MYLTHLSCINYRNIRECDLKFSEKFNCFLGANGMGKTNLLDELITIVSSLCFRATIYVMHKKSR